LQIDCFSLATHFDSCAFFCVAIGPLQEAEMNYTATDYARERAICDKAETCARAAMSTRGPSCCYLTAEEAQHPDYAACNNEMRGRVEQFELLRDKPAAFVAYLANGNPDSVGARLPVTVWTGEKLGTACIRSIGPRRGFAGERQRYGRAIIGGTEYAWQGPGAGMYARFRKLKRQPLSA
jgi:hypothetical protein